MNSCHLFLILSAFVRYTMFLSFILPIFSWNVPVVYPIFLKRTLVFPILFFFSISLHCSLRKAFLSLLAIIWNSAFKWEYLSFSSFAFSFSLFSVIYKASSDSHFAILCFFYLVMVLINASCTLLCISVHRFSGWLSDQIPWIYLSLLLYNHKRFDLGHTWMAYWFSLLSSI